MVSIEGKLRSHNTKSLPSASGGDMRRVEGKAKSMKFAKYFGRPNDLKFHWLGTVPSQGTL